MKKYSRGVIYLWIGVLLFSTIDIIVGLRYLINPNETMKQYNTFMTGMIGILIIPINLILIVSFITWRLNKRNKS